MLVKMLETKLGSPDGIQVNEYKKGEEYDLPSSLAQVFLDEGWAEEVKESKKPGPEQNKVDSGPNENKSESDDLEKELVHVGGGYYELPNGEKVKGKENALEELRALKEDGDK
jgi:hypothetical protein